MTFGAVGIGPAHADMTQLIDASRINSLDIASYTTGILWTNSSSPDVTCGVPTVVAGPATIAMRAVVGEVYGTDVAIAHDDCVSLQGHVYSATLTLWLQYQPVAGASFVAIPGCSSGSVTGGSVSGVVSLTTPVTTCSYDIRSPAYNKPHRAYAVLTNTEVPGATYPGASPVVWPGGLNTAAIHD
jgi:hypothetical protein